MIQKTFNITASHHVSTPTINKHPIGLFSIAIMTIISLDSIRNLPAIALFGTPLIFFFLIGGIMFLIPSALVSAELMSGFSKDGGGIYKWVMQAFGKKYGFIAIWFQWIENVFWYPTILSFIAGSFAYLISPKLAENKFYLMSVLVGVFWIISCVNLRGIKMSARFSTLCGIFGLIIPVSLIIILCALWILKGNPLQIHFTRQNLIPDFSDPDLLVSLTAVVLCFCGMEMSTVHSQDVSNPQKNYPRAMMISVIFVLITMLLVALAIAIIVPTNQLILVSGLVQAFYAYLDADQIYWLKPIIALCIILGSLGTLSNWIIAPNRGLLMAMHDIEIEHRLRSANVHGMPAGLIIMQAIIVTLLSCIFLLIPSVNGSYWTLTAMTAQLYMGMYILMFASAIYLRFTYTKSSHKPIIPGGKIGIVIIAGAGLITSIFTIIIGFFPPPNINIGSIARYESIMTIGLLLMSSPPFFIYRYYHRKKIAQIDANTTVF